MKVLLALDGSHGSKRALEFACEWLAGRDAAVTVLHVIAEHLLYGRAGVVPTEVYDLNARARAQRLLDEAMEYLREGRAGASFNPLVKFGSPEELTLEAAPDEGADRIIIGSRGLGMAGRFLLGSVSTRVATHAHCAVLVVHPKQEETDR